MAKTFTKEHTFLSVSKAGAVFTLETGVGWVKEGINNFVSQNYIDLAGMTKQAKTAFFEAGGVQDASLPSGVTAPGDVCIIADIMTSKPLTPFEAVSFTAGLGNFSASVANVTFDQTIYARVRTFISDIDTVNANYMVLIGDNQLGSLEPTASDRIYSTRVVSFGNNTDGVIGVWPCRHLLRAIVEEEPEYQYLMRLKRSYELQQSSDVDGNRPH